MVLFLAALAGMSSFAQGDRILVGGTILNKATGKPVDMNTTSVEILSFDTGHSDYLLRQHRALFKRLL